MVQKRDFERVDNYIWELPKDFQPVQLARRAEAE